MKFSKNGINLIQLTSRCFPGRGLSRSTEARREISSSFAEARFLLLSYDINL